MNYHNRIMNIPTTRAKEFRPQHLSYKEGHRDARHAATEIAIQADRDIEDLVRCVYELREVLCSVDLDDEDNAARGRLLVSSTELLQRLDK